MLTRTKYFVTYVNDRATGAGGPMGLLGPHVMGDGGTPRMTREMTPFRVPAHESLGENAGIVATGVIYPARVHASHY